MLFSKEIKKNLKILSEQVQFKRAAALISEIYFFFSDHISPILISFSFKLVGELDSPRKRGHNGSARGQELNKLSCVVPVSQQGLYQISNFSVWLNNKHLEMASSQERTQS